LRHIDPSAYASICTSRSRALNLYIDQTKPWALAKQGVTSELHEVIFTLLEGIRWLATAWMPLLPFGMPSVFKQLGLEPPQEFGALKELQWGTIHFQPIVPSPIYPRIEIDQSRE
jgi:methionyl-tRNA synthetase